MNNKIILLSLLLLSANILNGCYKMPQLPPEIIPQVEVAQVESRDVQLYSYATGYTDASHSVDVAARVEGVLEEVYFTESEVVEKGTPLFLIEPQNYQAQYNSKLANLEVLKAKQQLTEANLERVKVLVEKNTLTLQDYQTNFAEHEQAKASVTAGEADAEIAKISLEYTAISAPIKGMINRKTVDIGNVVGPGTGHTTLTTIKCLDPLHIYYDLTDVQFNAMMNNLAKGRADDAEPKTAPLLQREEGKEPISFEIALAGDLTDKGEPVYSYKGIINYIDNSIGRDVGKITCRGEISNPNYHIFPGQICSIRIPYAVAKNAVIIREVAILTDLSDKYVLVVDAQNNVRRRTVLLGDLVDSEHRIVLSGLEVGENYIVSGLQKAKVGKPVRL